MQKGPASYPPAPFGVSTVVNPTDGYVYVAANNRNAYYWGKFVQADLTGGEVFQPTDEGIWKVLLINNSAVLYVSYARFALVPPSTPFFAVPIIPRTTPAVPNFVAYAPDRDMLICCSNAADLNTTITTYFGVSQGLFQEHVSANLGQNHLAGMWYVDGYLYGLEQIQQSNEEILLKMEIDGNGVATVVDQLSIVQLDKRATQIGKKQSRGLLDNSILYISMKFPDISIVSVDLSSFTIKQTLALVGPPDLPPSDSYCVWMADSPNYLFYYASMESFVNPPEAIFLVAK